MANLSEPTKLLIQKYQGWYASLQPEPGISTVHVDEVASRVASFYEKVRVVVEWREEHLLRKTAIERALKRRLFLRKNGENVASPLVYELIRGGHFPNDRIPEFAILEVQKLIDKYIFILENSSTPKKAKQKVALFDWLLSIAASDLEEVLAPPLRERALIDYMTGLMKERIILREGMFVVRGLTEEETKEQIFIAAERTLFNLDNPLISYHLLRKAYPDWHELSSERLKEIAENIYQIWEDLEKKLSHPLSEKFYGVCERYDTPYLILGDILSQSPQDVGQLLSDPAALENKIKEIYNGRLKKLKAKLRRATIYSTISIFLTKMMIALSLEVPIERYITGGFNLQTLGISIAAPPLLMFFLVMSIRPPKKSNLGILIMEVSKIVYEGKRTDTYEIKPPQKRGVILNAVIVLFYLASFVLSFGLIAWALKEINFGIPSIIVFLMFVSLISFTGVKIRQRAKELVVEKAKESFLLTLVDLFSLPIIRVGKWLSGQWARYNLVTVLLTSLVDMPFQLFVEFLEQWRAFLKEKKEGIH